MTKGKKVQKRPATSVLYICRDLMRKGSLKSSFRQRFSISFVHIFCAVPGDLWQTNNRPSHTAQKWIKFRLIWLSVKVGGSGIIGFYKVLNQVAYIIYIYSYIYIS